MRSSSSLSPSSPLFARLRRAKWLHGVQFFTLMFWVMNPFPGALSYWTDTNGDHVKEEVANPAEGDSWWEQDSDGDGLQNSAELLFGSDPYQIDADFDGLTDQVERDYADPTQPLDPWSYDSDADGFSDHDEYYQYIQSYQPVVNYTSLSNAGTAFYSYSDADGDGLKNYEDGDPLNFDRDWDGTPNWQDGSPYFNTVGGQWMDDANNGVWVDPGVYIGGSWYPSGTVDSDYDGVPDHLDAFPWGSFTYNGMEYGGSWSDSDYDGIPDVADSYPYDSNNGYTPPPAETGFEYNGNWYSGSWSDSDSDCIPDVADGWPNDPNNGYTPPPIDVGYIYNGNWYPGSWTDSDNDGIPDPADGWPNDPNNGMFYYNGTWYSGSWSDSDGDNIPDVADAWPYDATNGQFYYNGSWYSGVWSDVDNDSIPDIVDAWPNDPNNGQFYYNGTWYWGGWSDIDNDGIPDVADGWPNDPNNGGFTYNGTWYWGTWSDSDSDGIPDMLDGWPNDANNGYTPPPSDPGYTYNGSWYPGSWNDSDSDGIPDVADGWPYDATNGANYNYNPTYDYNGTTYSGTWSDSDNDGAPDPQDSHSWDSNRWSDFDNDSRNAADDSHPEYSWLWSDWNFNGNNNDTDGDEDGFADIRDSHPRQSWLWADWNGDGSNDDPSADFDADSHSNENDSHPTNNGLWSDWNFNGTNNDSDGDEDGHPDEGDSHPRDAALWSDWNFNGSNNDTDGDEDGTADADDSHPRYAGLRSDWNGDGDDNDSDGDEDGVDNSLDTHPHNSALNSDADGDGHNVEDDSHPQNNQLWSDWDGNGINNDLDGDEDGWANGSDSHPHQQNLWNDFDGDNVNADHDSNPQDNTLWSDWNRDGDNNDTDWDEDSTINEEDSDPYTTTLHSDWNHDGDDNDQDGDEDGAVNDLDSHPRDPAFWGDWNFDGTNDTPADNADGDARDNATDSDPLNPALWSDWNHDGTNHATDGDEDGVPNEDDSDPFNPALSTDWNHDGDDNPDDMDEDSWPNTLLAPEGSPVEGSDSHPRDPSLWSDWDGNGTNNDADGDEDGILNATDSHPRHAALWSDWDFNQINNDQDGDEDGVLDSQDSDPRNNTLRSDWNHNGTDNESDWDEDGHDNGSDTHPANASLWSDYDGDSRNAENDSHPQDGSLWSDWNKDGDNHATDGDEDGFADLSDSDPHNAALWIDWNHDGYNDGSEPPDDDGDGFPNDQDQWPLDPENNADSDGDGLVNYDERHTHNTDPYQVDSDGDGLTDHEELLVYHTNPLAQKTNAAQLYTDYYVVDTTDSDGDHIPDRIEQWYAELSYGMNPNDSADATGDLDGDGVTNLQAYNHGWNLVGNLNLYDLDGDRILDTIEDAWAASHPGSLNKNVFADAVADFDNDGVMNFEEITLGLDLASASSARGDGLTDAEVLAWGLLAGEPLNASTDAVRACWEQIGEAWLDFHAGSYYEPWLVRTDANNDQVPDGLAAFRAEFWGPWDLWRYDAGDCDGDGISDLWEYRHHFELRDSQDSYDDPDGDTLVNLSEFQLGTHPRIADSDADGYADNVEQMAGTDANSKASNPANLPLVLYAVSGDYQSVLPGQTLSAPLIVQAMRGGIPWPGVTVMFSALEGSFGTSTVTTGADGRASTTYTVAAQPVQWEVPLSAAAAGGVTTLNVYIQDVDTDSDGWSDRLEQQQGGDAANPAATPVTQNPALAVALRSYDTDSLRASDFWWWSESADTTRPAERFYFEHWWNYLGDVDTDGDAQATPPSPRPLRPYPLEQALTTEAPWQAISRDSLAFAGALFGYYWMDTIIGFVPRYGAPHHPWIPTFSRCDYTEHDDLFNLEEGGNGWGVAWNRVRLSMPGPLPQDYEENYLQVTKRWNRDNFDEPPTVVDVTAVKMTLRKGQTKGDWLYLTPVSLDNEILTVSLLPMEISVGSVEAAYDPPRVTSITADFSVLGKTNWGNVYEDYNVPQCVIDYDGVLADPNTFEIKPFASFLDFKPRYIPNHSARWTKVGGPSSGTLSGGYAYSTFNDPKEGGVYEFDCTFFEHTTRAYLVLPLAGAEVKDLIAGDIIKADAFATKVNAKYNFIERNLLTNGLRWFRDDGAGDYLGRPDNAQSRTVWKHNQVSSAGMGAVCTWFGTAIRVGKLSNFLVAYACRKIGVAETNALIAQWIGTSNDGSAIKSWEAGWQVGGGATYSTTVQALVKDVWGESDQKTKRLWPNSSLLDNQVSRSAHILSMHTSWDRHFSSPGFLEMTTP